MISFNPYHNPLKLTILFSPSNNQEKGLERWSNYALCHTLVRVELGFEPGFFAKAGACYPTY